MVHAREYLTDLYIDYRNNYLTIEKFAEHNGITPNQALKLIEVAIDVFTSDHPEA